ncbi:YncE family protein [Granulicella tundricola]|uniref:40-residue YVTN family beta-propeller repeat protein n=1 Tax=Granulicella tundricola (strain ATCC BAA-1859 / DSM 23138 / MP5ACTX9) TaxID=1198114 RepID=E8X4J6_GRATM|nr:hypothetical protein [Granulicella tundricola]ADW69406.1 hypothetical protein AciX9_2369 [Granulicella tundricola MP5ACTX9]
MHSVHQHAAVRSSSRRIARPFARFALALAAVSLAGCGNQYRPVVSSVNPVGPASQPGKYAVAVSSNGTTSPGLVTIVDFSGDTTLITANLGANPQYLIVDPTGSEGYVLNGDGTFNSFAVSTSLLTSNVLQSTLPVGAAPVAILPQGTNLYIAEAGRNAIGQLTGSPSALKQELVTGPGTVYTVGISGAPRVYAITQGATGTAGAVKAIETTTNTISNTINVGTTPVYGVMTSDARRAFILNKGSNTVTVINSQTNAPDTFTGTAGTATNTIAVGTAPLWADFDNTRSELLVANAGGGTATTPGSVTVINIPLCSANTVTTNPNCDVNNPVDAVGFGQVLANIPVGVNPVQIAVLADGSQAFVANAGNAAAGIAGSVSIINLQTDTVVATIPAANTTVQGDAFVHGHPGTIAVTAGNPTGKVYITSPDSTDLTVIRTDTDQVQTHITLQGNGVYVRTNLP